MPGDLSRSIAALGARGRTRSAADHAQGELGRLAAELGTVLRTAGVHAALGHLNARVRFRFTGLFRPEPPNLRNIHLFDRENPLLDVSGQVISLDDGYCGLTCATNAPFRTTNAPLDPRLRTHPARLTMQSYAGVPVRLPGAGVWGTLCHFDSRPRMARASELVLLETVMPFFAAWLATA